MLSAETQYPCPGQQTVISGISSSQSILRKVCKKIRVVPAVEAAQPRIGGEGQVTEHEQ